MRFDIIFSDLAKEQISEFKRTNLTSYNKIKKLIMELGELPTTGTGKPEKLKGDYSEYWSRRINKKDRLIYKINNDEVYVFILSVYGHYDDK